MSKRALIALLFVATTATAAPPKPYHVELEAYPAAAFPSFRKFGTVTLHVYPAGVRAETFLLNAFSRNGARTVTVVNPVSRMYSDVPITDITGIFQKMSNSAGQTLAPPPIAAPISGNVRGVAARRYRMMYGPEAWIDVWTTSAVPENAQLRTLVAAMVRGISPSTAVSLQSVPGTPLYVELNFSHYKKLPFLRLKKFTRSNAGQEDDLRVGSFYFHAPMLDSILK
jgi:hypothetical protein